jgi:hypothetical protein
MLKYDGVDHQGGLQYSRYDRNRVEGVYKEAMKKEKDLRDSHPRSTTFQMNMVNGNKRGDLVNLKHSHDPNMIIAEKVEKRSPLERNTTPPHRTAGDEYGNQIIRHVEKAPWQKVDLPQSRAQEIGWLVAASMTSDRLNAQRSHSTGSNVVGHARKEAIRTASLADLSSGKLGVDPNSNTAFRSMSQTQLPRLIPHLKHEVRPEVRVLNKHKPHPKNTCSETVYADKYYAVMRHSPFNQAASRGGKPPTESRD